MLFQPFSTIKLVEDVLADVLLPLHLRITVAQHLRRTRQILLVLLRWFCHFFRECLVGAVARTCVVEMIICGPMH